MACINNDVVNAFTHRFPNVIGGLIKPMFESRQGSVITSGPFITIQLVVRALIAKLLTNIRFPRSIPYYIQRYFESCLKHSVEIDSNHEYLPHVKVYPVVPTTTMTSSNGNNFRVTGPLCGEFTGQRWIPLKGQRRGALCFLSSVAE